VKLLDCFSVTLTKLSHLNLGNKNAHTNNTECFNYQVVFTTLQFLHLRSVYSSVTHSYSAFYRLKAREIVKNRYKYTASVQETSRRGGCCCKVAKQTRNRRLILFIPASESISVKPARTSSNNLPLSSSNSFFLSQ
jgi:hypothetical protein